MADIAYRGGHIPSEAAGVNFELDAGAALKALLAPMNRQQRVSGLVEAVAGRQNPTTYPAAQLLEDEGSLAHQAILNKTKELDINKEAQGDKARHYGMLYAVLNQTDASYSITASSPNTTTTGPKSERIQYVAGY